MKKAFIALLAMGFLWLLASCTADSYAWQTITAAEAYTIMAEAGHFIILDVRTEAEFQQTRIAGAVLLPYDEIYSRAEELPDRNTVILAYCRSGRRSALAAATLAELGYSAVYDFGGIIDWPFETVAATEETS